MGPPVPLDSTLDGPVLFAEKDPGPTNQPIVGVEGNLLKTFSSSTSFFRLDCSGSSGTKEPLESLNLVPFLTLPRALR
jgi:hypothetical protein